MEVKPMEKLSLLMKELSNIPKDKRYRFYRENSVMFFEALCPVYETVVLYGMTGDKEVLDKIMKEWNLLKNI